MKKILLECTLLFSLISFSICLYAQVPKLNNAFNASRGIVVDSKGYVFVTGANNKIIRITPAGKAELFAGGGRNAKDARGKDAGFSDVAGIAIDSFDNMYVADRTRIRKITPDASVTTVIGTMVSGSTDGDRATATFFSLENIAIDNKGTLYVTDREPSTSGSTGYYYVRKITAQGVVSTIKSGNGEIFKIHYPRGITCDASGNLYISCNASHCVRKITPSGIITTFAGQCDKTVFNSVYKEGPVSTAVLTTPCGIACSANGDIYISDVRLHRIIRIGNNKVTTMAGTGKFQFSGNPAGAAEPGYADGKALAARFEAPNAIAFDRNGNLFIVDRSNSNNSYIRKLSRDGIVTTFCKHEWNPKTSQYEETE
jgi:hypothetical protein